MLEKAIVTLYSEKCNTCPFMFKELKVDDRKVYEVNSSGKASLVKIKIPKCHSSVNAYCPERCVQFKLMDTKSLDKLNDIIIHAMETGDIKTIKSLITKEVKPNGKVKKV